MPDPNPADPGLVPSDVDGRELVALICVAERERVEQAAEDIVRGRLFGRSVSDRTRLYVAAELEPPWVLLIGDKDELEPDDEDEPEGHSWVPERLWSGTQLVVSTRNVDDPLKMLQESASLAVRAGYPPVVTKIIDMALAEPDKVFAPRGRLTPQFGADLLRIELVLESAGGTQAAVALLDTGANIELMVNDRIAKTLNAPRTGAMMLRGVSGAGFPMHSIALDVRIGSEVRSVNALVGYDFGDTDCIMGLPLMRSLRGSPEIDRAFRELLGEGAGLTLFLSSRLLPWDQTLLHAFVCSVLGTDTDIRVAEYTETTEHSSRIRLTGSSPDGLLEVAQHIADVTWRAEEQSMLQAGDLLQVPRVLEGLDYIRSVIEKMELWWNRSGTAEMLEDQAAEHISKKDAALVRTWGNKLLRAGWEAVKKKLGKEIFGEVEDGVKGLLESEEDH
jgi:hypothetical protein